jgi:putative Mg2+ transporter-C (MgtC) family protein
MLAVSSVSDGELVLRLAVAVLLCGAIGLERQARDQVAGLRTHVIVGLGAALFTLVSAYAFTGRGFGTDPTRIAAQVVSGIGFLGAGAILRHGATVRGVTTAAALWISAAVGMAAAAGFYFGAAATTVMVLLVLVALRRLRPLLRRRLGTETLSLELRLQSGASLRRLLAELRARGLQVEGLESRALDEGSEQLKLDLRGPASLDVDSILSELSQLPDVARIDRALLHSLEVGGEDETWPPDGDAFRLPRGRRARRDARGPSDTGSAQ